MFAREALDEGVAGEAIDHAGLLLRRRRRPQKLAVRVQQTGEAAHERRADLVRVEGGRADDDDLRRASRVRGDAASRASVYPIL